MAGQYVQYWYISYSTESDQGTTTLKCKAYKYYWGNDSYLTEYIYEELAESITVNR